MAVVAVVDQQAPGPEVGREFRNRVGQRVGARLGAAEWHPEQLGSMFGVIQDVPPGFQVK